mmetsp:Transcript_104861/g.313281  ORF Transcript_104861/g.313281 Transcript_104861/m.313281 type:complete len:205 (+) Transcript_104861:402-1016(+)
MPILRKGGIDFFLREASYIPQQQGRRLLRLLRLFLALLAVLVRIRGGRPVQMHLEGALADPEAASCRLHERLGRILVREVNVDSCPGHVTNLISIAEAPPDGGVPHDQIDLLLDAWQQPRTQEHHGVGQADRQGRPRERSRRYVRRHSRRCRRPPSGSRRPVRGARSTAAVPRSHSRRGRAVATGAAGGGSRVVAALPNGCRSG